MSWACFRFGWHRKLGHSPFLLMIRILALVLVLAAAVRAEEAPVSEEVRRAMITSFTLRKAEADAALEKAPKDLEALSQRGDMRLFLGDAKGAVADFEQEIAIEPSHDAPHWRLGIAYYFAGEFRKSAKQFEKYQTYESGDRENGIWKFLAQAKVDGVEKARKEMIEYTRFDREPFPGLYEMFAGKKTAEEVLADVEKKGGGTLVQFFAHYYIGLNEELMGRVESAREHLGKAVKLAGQAGAGGGPGYMGQVARLQYEAVGRK